MSGQHRRKHKPDWHEIGCILALCVVTTLLVAFVVVYLEKGAR